MAYKYQISVFAACVRTRDIMDLWILSWYPLQPPIPNLERIRLCRDPLPRVVLDATTTPLGK